MGGQPATLPLGPVAPAIVRALEEYLTIHSERPLQDANAFLGE